MKIGISETATNFHRYNDWLDHFKVAHENLSYKNNEKDLKKLEDCSGLILTGGVDIYPEVFCDWDTVESRGSYEPERDGFELKLMEMAIERKMPILGICRGCQIINVYFRGSLIFDLFDIRGVHHDRISPTEDRIHDVNILNKTLLNEITGENVLTVNSAHHQAVDRLGEGLKINCKASDGVVEGVEYVDHEDNPFLLGVMWHPERLSDRNSPASMNIINRFTNEAKKYHETI